MKKIKKTYYPLHQSPLFKLQSKKRLFSLLNINQNDFKHLSNKKNNYFVFESKNKTGKIRMIQEPKKILASLHNRIFSFLKRIEPPNYLQSFKGRSYITNAKQHINLACSIKFDIVRFYESTKKYHVYEFFYNIMQCSSDVAGILAELCTYNDHLPTGSSVSPLLAFYSHLIMFQKIEKYSKMNHLVMTCYIDDITISGEKISHKNLFEVRKILKSRGLESHKKKEKIYFPGSNKLVTGIIVAQNNLKLPNKRHKEIYNLKKQIIFEIIQDDVSKKIRSFIGKINAAMQIDPKYISLFKNYKNFFSRVLTKYELKYK